MAGPTHADGMLFMEYYKLWDTPLDGEAWQLFRELAQDGTLAEPESFAERVPRTSREYVLFDRICCSFEQAGVLMKNGLLHPDLYFDAWASPTAAWTKASAVIEDLRTGKANRRLYENFEWLAKRGEAWYAEHD